MTWKVPSGWSEERPSSNMRRAQYRVPGPAGDGECVVFYFGPGQGGDPMSNAARWASQFKQLDGRSPEQAMKASKLDVPSPLDGIVSRVIVHSGDRTAVGDKLMTLVDTRIMELSVTVPSEQLSNVGPGTPIEFEVDAYPGERFTGTVDRLNPTTEPGTRQVSVYTRIPNPDGRLMGGLFDPQRIQELPDNRPQKGDRSIFPLGK